MDSWAKIDFLLKSEDDIVPIVNFKVGLTYFEITKIGEGQKASEQWSRVLRCNGHTTPMPRVPRP